jgi:hypothetical protein
MDAKSPRWKEVTPSQFPWEREALAYLRNHLPDRDPFRAWSNFEFIADDGSVNEVDLLVLAPRGLFLIEIKSRPGKVSGSESTWTWTTDGRVLVTDNPILLANRKAKRLKSVLHRTKAMQRQIMPFIQELVFLSAQGIRSELKHPVSSHVCVRPEGSKACPQHQDIVDTLVAPVSAYAPRGGGVDSALAKALTRAMEEGIARRTTSAKQLGDYRLVQVIQEGPGYQDWSAERAGAKRASRRIRIYMEQSASDATTRQTLVRAARREFDLLEGIEHTGIPQSSRKPSSSRS